MDMLSSEEAAALLGVTRQTLYAYVSRGLIAPVQRGAEGGGSRYVRTAVEVLAKTRRRGRRPREIARATLDVGLPVLETAITLIERGRLAYRGEDAVTLARTASLEEVGALLWQMPLGAAFPNEMADGLPAFAGQADPETLLARFATAAPGDDTAEWRQDPARLALGCGMLVRLLAAAALGMRPLAAPIHLQCATAWGLGPEAAERVREALVLCADHELNVSGFTARCVASAGASLKAAVVGALAALSGARHGGQTASIEAVWRMLAGVPDVPGSVRDLLAGGLTMPGFGHPLYPAGDVRAKAILAGVAAYGTDAGAIAAAVQDLTGQPPNIDFALVALRRALGLPEGSAFLIFALGRSVGWIAHALEQRASGTLIRPRAVYVGPSASAAAPAG